jgi:hypothetical protein
MNATVPVRTVVIAGTAVLLALSLGYALAGSHQVVNLMFVALVLGVMAIPLVLKWHHAALVLAWNAWLVVPFLPSSMELWIALSGLSLAVTILRSTLLRERREFIRVPQVERPLIALFLVVLLTITLTGGLGSRLLGSEMWGAGKYLSILGSIIGYFALTAQRIPSTLGPRMASFFFLSGVTAMGSTLVYVVGPALFWLFFLFPPELVALQMEGAHSSMVRYAGLAIGARAICFALLARYGLRGVLDWHRPWRLGLFGIVFVAGFFGGFRSYIILMLMIITALFFFEGLHRTRYLFAFTLGGVLAGAILVSFADQLPLPVQRAVSFLPIDIHPDARRDAEGTLLWRFEMWKHVVPEIPKYLWVGKGYGFSGLDYVLTQLAFQRGIIFSSYEAALINGAYHQGVLTLLLPLGLPGLIAFFWFCWVALRVLYRNYKYGPDALRIVNTFLLSIFCARLLFYIFLYGQFELDLPLFVGVVGLGLSLNGGVCSPPSASDGRAAIAEPAPATANAS